MSISRRTSRTVRYVGVASAAAALALGVAGTASACQIGDFSISGQAQCDQANSQGLITVHDTDGTRPVTLTVKDDSGKQINQKEIDDRSSDLTITVPWSAGEHLQVLVTVPGHFTDSPINGGVTLPNTACAAPTKDSPTPTPSDSSSAPAAPTSAPPSTSAPSPAESSAAAVADTNSPAPSPSGNLAETGGSSATPVIAGVAAALVVAGGGTVFFLRRRTPAARH